MCQICHIGQVEVKWQNRMFHISDRSVSGWTKNQATLGVFLFSAFLHEYLVSVPFQIFRVWLFTGILAQVPLIVISQQMSPRMGNFVMWLFLIVGKPAVVLMYFHDYYICYLSAAPNECTTDCSKIAQFVVNMSVDRCSCFPVENKLHCSLDVSLLNIK